MKNKMVALTVLCLAVQAFGALIPLKQSDPAGMLDEFRDRFKVAAVRDDYDGLIRLKEAVRLLEEQSMVFFAQSPEQLENIEAGIANLKEVIPEQLRIARTNIRTGLARDLKAFREELQTAGVNGQKLRDINERLDRFKDNNKRKFNIAGVQYQDRLDGLQNFIKKRINDVREAVAQARERFVEFSQAYATAQGDRAALIALRDNINQFLLSEDQHAFTAETQERANLMQLKVRVNADLRRLNVGRKVIPLSF